MPFILRRDVVFTLALWYLVYVVFDVVSTYWLINNTPAGLNGELNPIGVAFYSSFGLTGILLVKIAGFIPMSIGSILVDGKFGEIKWVRESVETMLLALIGLSSLAAIQNFGSVVVTEFFMGQVESLAKAIAVASLLFALALVYAMSRFVGLWDRVRVIEALAGTLIVVGPLFLWSDLLASAIKAEPLILIAYTLIMYSLVAAAVYLVDEIRARKL